MNPNEDGTSHINIYSQGRTELGRMMSNWAHLPVRIDGKFFQSLEGYWYWLSTGRQHQVLEVLHGYEAKKIGKTFSRVQMDEKEFEDLIAVAMQCKVQQHPKLIDLLKASTLPFTHYYVFGGLVRDAGFQWIVDEWEALRYHYKQENKT